MPRQQEDIQTMKKVLVACCLLGLGAGTASAEPPNPAPAGGTQIAGSDTLREIAIDVLAACGVNVPTPVLNYIGGGSTGGGDAMRARNQQVAPQSRFLSSNECDDFGASPLLGEGIAIGLDGLANFGDGTEATTCNTLRYSGDLTVTDRDADGTVECPNCTGNVYTFSDWRDVLRIVYGGQSAHISMDGCSDADPSRTPVAQRDCASDLRAELVASWSNLFQGGCTDTECTQGLRHAFRRDDTSGTTDTFLTLLALPAVAAGNPPAPQRTFCNGLENEDNDPIRRACDANEQVCTTVPFAFRGSATGPATAVPGDLGLVLPISLPQDLSVQYDDNFAFCTGPIGGTFKLAPMPTALLPANQRCPDGNARTFNQCRWLVDNNATPGDPNDDKFNCLARQGNRPGSRAFANMDARAYNLIPRHPTTGAILLPNPSGVADPRWGGGGWYRIHEMAPLATGAGTCRLQDATQQIGCLVGSSPCSIGFAGLEGATATTKAFNLRSPVFPSTENEVAATPGNVRRLSDPTGGPCNGGAGDDFGIRYPLSRKLWFNASKGFGLPTFANITNIVDSSDADTIPDLTTREQDWTECFADREITDQAVVDNGFITITPTNCSGGGCTAAELSISARARACQARCGNGIVEAAETCDDGNVIDGDACPADCTVP
jgi:cysteine-rich repeat protein